MNRESDLDLTPRGASALMDVLIRAGLILALALLCYRVFAPFLTLLAWSLILAVTLYPMHQALARRIGGRQGLAATLVALAGVVLIVLPTALLMSSFGDSVRGLVASVQDNSLQVPPPRESVAQWPVVGERAYALWSQAYEDMPALVESMQPKIGELAKTALGVVAGIGGALLMFLAAIVVAGIVMAFGQAGTRGVDAIFVRIAGPARGSQLAALSTATIRAVAQGVIGVAFIQALLVGLCLLVAGVPWAGVLSAIVLVLGVAQVPAIIVTLPAIAWLWTASDHGTGAATAYSVLLFVAGMADNVLKPLMLGRGVDAPMPVILIGALGGLATAGILGMFVGATLLALGYQIFMGWVDAGPAVPVQPVAQDGPSVAGR